MTKSESGAYEEDMNLEVPEEPEKEDDDDDQDLDQDQDNVESSGGSMINFLTGSNPFSFRLFKCGYITSNYRKLMGLKIVLLSKQIIEMVWKDTNLLKERLASERVFTLVALFSSFNEK
jgi:hypothetical protein